MIVLELYCLLRTGRVPRLNPSFLNRLRLTEVRDLGELAIATAACDYCTGADEPETREEAKGVFGRDIEPRAACSGGEGKGMSKIPTSSKRRTSFFLPSSRLSTKVGNKNLEVAALILLWKPTEPKQGHSGTGLLKDPSLKTSRFWEEAVLEKELGGKG